MSPEEVRDKLLTTNDTIESLLELVNDIYIQEIHSEEKVLTNVLTELHNLGMIDFVKAVSFIDRSSFGRDFFNIFLIFKKILPSLNARVEDVLPCLVHLKHQADGDLAFNGIYRSFKHFCSEKVNRPIDSVEFILQQSELSSYASFLSDSILAYDSKRIDEAIHIVKRLLINDNEFVRAQTYYTLGMLEVEETKACVVWNLLNSSASKEKISSCRAAILKAVLLFGAEFPSYWQHIEELLISFFEESSPEILYEISAVLAFNKINFTESILYLLVRKLASISPEHTGIIDNTDHLLVKLLEERLHSLTIELLESMLAAGVKFILLDYFSHELLNKHQELLNHIITKWFLSGEPIFCHAVFDLLSHSENEYIELKADTILLDNTIKQIFVSRKAVGWLFMQPIMAVSFIISIYEVSSLEASKALKQILYDPMLLSYPGKLKQFFQSCIEEEIERSLCEHLLMTLQNYYSDLDKVSGLKELKAPKENISAYWQSFNKDMKKAYEEKSESSAIWSIVSKKKLLYGNSSIYYLNHGENNAIRQEVPLRSFSHSTEMPTLNVLDPESLDYILRYYRCERLKDEINS
ncbi:hypothetical protein [Providencia alcalifaciens]|uniref:hypothetical protein n=1 Tax=Providencia alcalifaciens TaxID=126385 RepID=UPI003D97DA26